jgi:hypothetical protein
LIFLGAGRRRNSSGFCSLPIPKNWKGIRNSILTNYLTITTAKDIFVTTLIKDSMTSVIGIFIITSIKEILIITSIKEIANQPYNPKFKN